MQILIIGGGIIGLACAWRLAQHGAQVTVLDAAPESREASWAAAGMLAPHHECEHDGPLRELMLRSLAGWPAFAEALGGAEAVDLRLDGGWHPWLDDADLHAVDIAERFLSTRGVAYQRLDAAAVRAIEPALNLPADRGALLMPGGQVNPRHAVSALISACVGAGVTIHYGAVVDAIDGASVRCGGSWLRADQVVLASGAWTPALAALTGLDLHGEPVAGQLLRFAAPDHLLRRFVHCRHAYVVPRRGAGIVVGSTMVWQGFDRRDDPQAIARLAASARQLVPALAQAPILETWTGLRPRLRSGLPCLARISPHAVVATGHFRNGILLTPITAAVVAHLCLGADVPEIRDLDLAPFNAAASAIAPDAGL